MVTARIASAMGSCPFYLLKVSFSLPPAPQPAMPAPTVLTLAAGPLKFSCHFILKAKGKTLKAFNWEVMRSHFFVIKITLNPVDELERRLVWRWREIHHRALLKSRCKTRGSPLSSRQKQWRASSYLGSRGIKCNIWLEFEGEVGGSVCNNCLPDRSGGDWVADSIILRKKIQN